MEAGVFSEPIRNNRHQGSSLETLPTAVGTSGRKGNRLGLVTARRISPVSCLDPGAHWEESNLRVISNMAVKAHTGVRNVCTSNPRLISIIHRECPGPDTPLQKDRCPDAFDVGHWVPLFYRVSLLTTATCIFMKLASGMKSCTGYDIGIKQGKKFHRSKRCTCYIKRMAIRLQLATNLYPRHLLPRSCFHGTGCPRLQYFSVIDRQISIDPPAGQGQMS
jgi:hypothetical protein